MKPERLHNLMGEIIVYLIQDQKEEEDFIAWCEDNELDPYTLGELHQDHIYGKILLVQHNLDFDIAPFCFTTEFLNKENNS